MLPKGWAERKVSMAEQAAREAFEEAGLEGTVSARPIGRYRYLKQLRSGRSVPCRVEVFALRVERQLEDWPEKGERESAWVTPAQAAGMVEESGLAALLLDVAARGAAALYADSLVGDAAAGPDAELVITARSGSSLGRRSTAPASLPPRSISSSP